MSSRREHEGERLGRLAGTGKGSGGGLPLPDLFSAILNELLDNGPANSKRLTGISTSTLEYKSNNVMATWGSWEALTDDALKQMASREIVSQNDDGLWDLGGKFTAGVPLVVIPAGKGRKADSVTIWPKGEREQLNRADHAEREAVSMVGRMRPVDNQRVSAIRQSEPEVGQLYPVLVDQNGRILDGAHRLEANPNWRKHTIKVDSEEMALAVGLWANSGQPLPAKIKARITELIGDLSGSNQIKRDRIKATLLEDASRSDREIGRLVGSDHKTVSDVRSQLVQTGEIPQFQQTGGRGVTTGTPGSKPSPAREQYDDATREAVLQEAKRRLKAGEKTDFRGMAAQFNVGTTFVQQMIAAAKELIKAEWQQQQEHAAPSQAERPTPPKAAPVTPPAPVPPQPVAGNGAEIAWSKIMGRLGRLAEIWRSGSPDPASERAELLAMRNDIDERLKALGG
jgi:hypothetical protein